MKKNIFFIAVLITTLSVAQTNNEDINYKAIIKDNLGNVVANQEIDVRFSVLYGTVLNEGYIEDHENIMTDANGLIILNIGDGVYVDGDYGDIMDVEWDQDQWYLNVAIDLGAGSGFVDLGTTAFKTVPYAFHATTATTALNAGATSINGLSDGKADASGSSLFLGLDAGANDDGTANGNVGVGYQALNSNTTGVLNTANGKEALSSNTIGNYNTANGALALSSNTEGIANTANGFWSLFSNTTGSNNTANGYAALYTNTIGSNNTANGISALFSNTSGSNNTANGYQALNQNIIGDGNVALGYKAGYSETGSDKLYIANTDTSTPLIYGDFDAEMLTINGDLEVTGSNNLASGLEAIDEGNGIGWRLKGRSPATYQNIGLNGVDLSYGISDGIVIATGSIGAKGSYSTAMGYDTGASGEYSTAMGVGTIAPSYAEIVVGRYNTLYSPINTEDWNSADRLFVVGNGIEGFIVGDSPTRRDAFTILKNGTTTINGTTNVFGNVIVSGVVIQNSDRRLKKDIETLPYGLKEVLQLQPKAYNWKDKTQEHKSLGLIAQDVQLLIKEIVNVQDDEAKTLGVSYTELIPVLINAIKEQQAQIEVLESKNNNQDTVLVQVLKRLNTLEATKPSNPNKENDLVLKE